MITTMENRYYEKDLQPKNWDALEPKPLLDSREVEQVINSYLKGLTLSNNNLSWVWSIAQWKRA